MTDDPGLFEIMRTMRAMRRLKPDPVPDDVQPLLGRLLELGLARRGTAGWWLSRALWTAVAAEAPSG